VSARKALLLPFKILWLFFAVFLSLRWNVKYVLLAQDLPV
jgi:hypothetical protein